MVVFGEHDLGQRSPFPRIDLVLCRNVLIYFTSELQKRVLQLFAFALRDRGVLVLGKAEATNPLPDHFALEYPRLKVFRRVGDQVLIPPARMPHTVLTRTPAEAPPRLMPFDLAPVRAQIANDRSTLGGLTVRPESILMLIAQGVIVVDRDYGIQFLNPAARRLLGIHASAIGGDLIHLAQNVSLVSLRDAVNAAFQGELVSFVHQVDPLLPETEERQFLEILCEPIRGSDDLDAVEVVLVQVLDVTANENTRRALGEHETRLQRLTTAYETLSRANEDLARTISRLRAANAELLVSNEEFQAATEEVETLNEELQATNEELETMNEELQATVEELNTTNEDLEARGVELHDLAVSGETRRLESETERARLEAVLANIGEGVMVIDRDGEIVLVNDAFVSFFGPTGGALQPTDSEGTPLPNRLLPQRLATTGEPFTLKFTVRIPDRGSLQFEASGQPILFDGLTGGGVVVIRDVTGRAN
jgi:two-component system CheB/CheR fusion protein